MCPSMQFVAGADKFFLRVHLKYVGVFLQKMQALNLTFAFPGDYWKHAAKVMWRASLLLTSCWGAGAMFAPNLASVLEHVSACFELMG